MLDEIVRHLQAGRRMGLLTRLTRRKWTGLVRRVTVNGRPPNSFEEFLVVGKFAELERSRDELRRRWDRQMATNGAQGSHEMGAAPESVCYQFAPAITKCLGWHSTTWLPLEQELTRAGFKWQEFLEEEPPDIQPSGELRRLVSAVTGRLPKMLAAHAAHLRWDKLNADLDGLLAILKGETNTQPRTPIVGELRRAVGARDSVAYRRELKRLVGIHDRAADLAKRGELLEKLKAVARGWAASIRGRNKPHDSSNVPGDARKAWLWRQLETELTRRASVSVEDLQERAERSGQRLRQVTAKLVSCRAWAAQIRRTTLPQQQALMGWLGAIRRIAGGHGKRVPLLRAEASRLMSQSRDSVPVWIMPLARVAENFDPRTTRFDVVIIDEASQSDVMALLAFYLAERVVVVGDREQVSPVAVGQRIEDVERLIDEHLGGIPNAKLYDGRRSIYDVATESFAGLICLLEHFRSVPEIIQFSNHLSYNGRLKPLRDPTQTTLSPHVIPYRVPDGSRDGMVNRQEALTVASLLAAAIEQPEYADKTMGVISLLGDEQALEIERTLRRFLPADEIVARRIVCGNSAHFQGDERDVMFLSVVDVPREGGALPMRQREEFRQRYNVAASRAKDQMWVVYSLDQGVDLQPDDLRRRLIEHALDPHALLRQMAEVERKAESQFEVEVARRLTDAGYRVRPQFQVGHYRIDLVVEGGSARLAVECDGDRDHPIEKLPDDMARQAVLERLGWRFARIRGSHFFRDPEGAMERVFERLKALGIEPIGPVTEDDSAAETAGQELRDRIVRRAQEIRREWAGGEASDGGPTEQSEHDDLESPPTVPTESPEAKDGTVVPMPKRVSAPDHGAPAPSHSERRSTDTQRTIDEVPQAEVRAAIEACVPDSGAIEREDLLRLVSRELGFTRLARRIRKRLNRAIAGAVRGGRLRINGESVRRRAERVLPFEHPGAGGTEIE